MKKMEMKLNMEEQWLLRGMEELSVEEMNAIHGGESLWYWIGYAISSFSSNFGGSQTGERHAMSSTFG